ncbi:alkene reductase, partial [Hypericibacter adhaerens]|uniref:alkene reductase n=1 Tax=Hypericibacter adhaerens TaxID=2602016 RepID=UPI003BB97A32
MMKLFEPIKIGRLTLPNRIAMAPMTRNRAGPGNVPTPLNVLYYRQRAGAGLIITEGSQVSPQGVGYPNTPGIHTAEQVKGWRAVTDAVHAAGGRIFLQLWHVGRTSHPSMQPNGELPISSSAIAPEGEIYTFEGMKPYVAPRALGTAEVKKVVEDFRHGARCSLEAGFDGVEIHGANGYLVEQFLVNGTNKRTDIYGGSVENRTRFLAEVTTAVAEVWGADRVGVRLSPNGVFGSSADTDRRAIFHHAAKVLDGFGLAYLHLIDHFPDDPEPAGGYILPREMRSHFHGPIMTNSGYTLEKAEATIARGDADMISFGASYIANPDLAERFRQGWPLNTPDGNTF